ncbi:HNH endonuclease [Maritimibacter sp. UBA3975]|uniref:HNH endonuclease n=1 Tax=Maritimibacter sp. UBA3975 TaxID=1946833 RepID=UPI0025C5245C|nr:HNH endonuclease [Maritimibacter sp. UBA3975]
MNGNNDADYVKSNGFGHDDWNFCYDIWEDNRLHLYIRHGPSRADQDKLFNVALGAVTDAGHVLVAFCESAKFEKSVLSRAIWEKRASDLRILDEQGQLGGEWRGKNVKDLADMLEYGDETFSLSVHPNSLKILDEPILIPGTIIKPNYYRYQLLRLTEKKYTSLRSLVRQDESDVASEEEAYSEGSLVLRVHKSRERSGTAPANAKDKFIVKNGSLFCEACSWKPESGFGTNDFKNLIIEAHHNVPISSPSHTGRTKTSDFKMLCPNCHRAIHRTKPMMTVDEFKRYFF